ncbi:MAG: hypothetical protein WA746_10145 [Isosphaeraceae bacterium]
MSGDIDRLTEVYSNRRSELERVGNLFLEASRRTPNLHFNMLVAPGLNAVGDEPWRELAERIQGGVASGENRCEEWFISEKGRKCGRCYGEATALEEFQGLAITADYLLHQLSVLPNTFGQRIYTFESKGIQTWLDHVYSTAVAIHSTLLYQIRDLQFDETIDELDPVKELDLGSLSSEDMKDQPVTRRDLIHPECFRLYPNLFLASFEAIRIWLDPTSRLSLIKDHESGDYLAATALSPIILPPPRLIPRWVNEKRGVLTFGGVKIKEITKPGENVRPILDAFEAKGWPNEMPDPLPNPQGLDYRDRLRCAVESLKDSHITPGRIQFGTKNDHTIVTWKALDPNDNESDQSGLGRL